MQLNSAKMGASLPAFSQKIPFADVKGLQGPKNAIVNSTFKLEASPKWFNIVSSEVNKKEDLTMTTTLGVSSLTKPPAGRVVRVITTWVATGSNDGGRIREYYYQIS